MKKIWNEENKIKKMIKVEVSLLKALSNFGYLKEDKVNEFEKVVFRKLDINRIKQIEKEIKHDIMALVKFLSEIADDEVARWIHFGATSNDITDSATAMLLKDSIKIIENKIRNLLDVITNLALRYKNLVCLGRTHGQAALPVTYGFRFALWASELFRHYTRILEAKNRICVGKMSGAVGTQAGFGSDGIEMERKVMEYLGLEVVEISNQVIPRDIYCEYISILANLATTLEKIATTIRLLQRTEVGEVMEKFEDKQVGSSTMPHKRNPIICEQICSLARVVRSFVIPQYECAILWEERDLTNSAAERIILAETTILLDHILTKMIDVFENLKLNENKIKENLEKVKDLNLSEAVMLELTKRGMKRQEAHELVRMASILATEKETTLFEQLKNNSKVLEYITPEELKSILRPEKYLGTAVKRVEIVCNKIKHALSI